ncbi:hypothetical protein QT972_32285 [Microcoleus sp. herbarium7]|uniref:hypothetical protein n=1 Tax=Microcoleus sp. herbarium7 TaxID=3055435 RepID=UPI002FD64C47
MVRGGRREGAGGQFKWKNGKTKTIRVPESLAEQILELARKLDEGISIIDHDTPSKVLDLSGISIRQHNGVIAVYLEDLVKAGYQILPERVSQLVEARIQKLLIDKQVKYGNNPQRRGRS